MANQWILPAAVVALLLPAGAVASDDGAQPPYYDVKLIGIKTTYGPESWKSNASFYQYGPVNGFHNYSSQFAASLGYHVELRVRLTDEMGAEIPMNVADVGQISLSAYIPTARGNLHAYAERDVSLCTPPVPVACTSPVFRLHFDMDGSSYDADGGLPELKAVPPLAPGLKYVKVDVTRRGALPSNTDNAGDDQLVFNYVTPTQTLNVQGVPPQAVRGIPDTAFRLLNDIGYGSLVTFVHEPYAPGRNMTATYDFGVPFATVELHAFSASRGCAPPACVPSPGSSMTVHRRSINTTAKTDASGIVSFSIQRDQLLSYPTRSFPSALVVLSAQLKPESDVNGTYPTKGSAGLSTGAIEAVVPVTGDVARVTAFEIDTRLQENASNAPDPFASLASSVNRITVVSVDEADVKCSNCGDALAYMPDREGIYARATIQMDPDPGFPKNREASLPVDSPPGSPGIRSAKITSYRVLNLFYHPPSSGPDAGSRADEFHAMALADRGFLLDVGATPRAPVDGGGTFWVNITSVNTNYDANPNERSFELKVFARVRVPLAKIYRNETFIVPEGQIVSRPYPVTAAGPGSHVIKVQATSGDVLSDSIETTIDFYEAPAKKRLRGIPGFEPALMVLAMMGATLLLRRKQAF